MNKVIENFILLILLFHKAKSDCLENIRKVQTSNQNAMSLTLEWDYTCGQCWQCDEKDGKDPVTSITFKIYCYHQKWIACDVNKRVSN